MRVLLITLNHIKSSSEQGKNNINDQGFSNNDIRKRCGGTCSVESMLGGSRGECNRLKTAVVRLIASNIVRLIYPLTKCSQSNLATYYITRLLER